MTILTFNSLKTLSWELFKRSLYASKSKSCCLGRFEFKIKCMGNEDSLKVTIKGKIVGSYLHLLAALEDACPAAQLTWNLVQMVE